MDNLLKQVLDEVVRLSKADSKFDYEEYMRLTDLRQQLVDQVERKERPLTEHQKKQIEIILSYDSLILQQMQRLKDEAEQGLRSIQTFRKQKAAYEYRAQSEGFMFDRKK